MQFHTFKIHLHPTRLFSLRPQLLAATLATVGVTTVIAPSALAEQITIGPFTQQVDKNSALVVWETDTASTGEVHYGKYPDMSKSATDSNSTTHHVIKLEGLDFGTQYAYEVKTASGTSPAAYFWTTVDLSSKFRLAVYGDTRSRFDAHKEVVDAMAKAKPLAYFNTGDLVSHGDEESDWLKFFQAESAMLQIAPFYPTLGNHEGSGARYLDLFELPNNSPEPEKYYSYRFATTSFAIVDMFLDYKQGSTQYDWLEKVLKDADADPSILHSFVLIHSGPYDSGGHGSNLTARKELVPLFNKYHVEIVFSGHDHDYERSTVDGVKYVVTGGGGAPTYDVDGDTWTEVKAAVTHYCLLDFEGPRLTMTALEPDGTQIDKFTLGDNVSDCSQPSDCTGPEPFSCGQVTGEWACVQGACLWSCVGGGSTGGAGGAGGGGGGDDQDAGASGSHSQPDSGTTPVTDSGSADDAPQGTGDGDTIAPEASAGENDDSCSCSTPGGSRTPSSPASSYAIIALALGALLRRRD